MAGHTRRVASPTAETPAGVLAPLIDDPARAAVLFDIDGTIAPIVDKAEDAYVPPSTSSLLGQLARRYALVACVSGRSAAEARRMVGVGSILYVGMHGAERLGPGATQPQLRTELEPWTAKVREFTESVTDGFRLLGIRIEDKGPIVALHWRRAPDEAAARRRLDDVAETAVAAGLNTHWGRKVLEIRPPVEISKRLAVRDLVLEAGASGALFAGDDTTDLDAFDALDELAAEGTLSTAIRIGVRSDEGPPELIERADLVVESVPGFAAVLETLVG
ncbi:MAG: trehalose 6-phosphate phosphatase [Thermoleophilaceae bacterium]|nr:trehalose 6-phosphate phosphatase [Thermoleophilaceae bacterium]